MATISKQFKELIYEPGTTTNPQSTWTIQVTHNNIVAHLDTSDEQFDELSVPLILDIPSIVAKYVMSSKKYAAVEIYGCPSFYEIQTTIVNGNTVQSIVPIPGTSAANNKIHEAGYVHYMLDYIGGGETQWASNTSKTIPKIDGPSLYNLYLKDIFNTNNKTLKTIPISFESMPNQQNKVRIDFTVEGPHYGGIYLDRYYTSFSDIDLTGFEFSWGIETSSGSVLRRGTYEIEPYDEEERFPVITNVDYSGSDYGATKFVVYNYFDDLNNWLWENGNEDDYFYDEDYDDLIIDITDDDQWTFIHNSDYIKHGIDLSSCAKIGTAGSQMNYYLSGDDSYGTNEQEYWLDTATVTLDAPPSISAEKIIDTEVCYEGVSHIDIPFTVKAYYGGECSLIKLTLMKNGLEYTSYTKTSTSNSFSSSFHIEAPPSSGDGIYSLLISVTDSRGQTTTSVVLGTITVFPYNVNIDNIKVNRVTPEKTDPHDPEPGIFSDEGTNAVISTIIDYEDIQQNYLKEPIVKVDNIISDNVEWYELWDSQTGFYGDPINFDDFNINQYENIIFSEGNKFTPTDDTSMLSYKEYYLLNIFKPTSITQTEYLAGTAVLNSDGSITVNGSSTHSGDINIYLGNIKLPFSPDSQEAEYLDFQPNYDGSTIGSAHLSLLQYNDKEVKAGSDVIRRANTLKAAPIGSGYSYYIISKYRNSQVSRMVVLIDGEVVDSSWSGSSLYDIQLNIDSLPASDAVVEIYYMVIDGTSQSTNNVYPVCLSINYSGELINEVFYPKIIADSNIWDSSFTTGNEQFLEIQGNVSGHNPHEEGWYIKIPHFEPPITLYGWIKDNLNTTISYSINIIGQTYWKNSNEVNTILPQAFYLLSAPEGGHGLGIGRKVPIEAEGRGLHVGMDAVFYEDVIFKRMAGIIQMYAGVTPPNGWLPCDGRSLLIAEYPELAETLYDENIHDYIYGSADSTHFNLPDFSGRMPLGTSEDYDEGDTGGSPYIQAHTHTGTYTRPTVSKSVSSADSITGGSHSHALSGNNKTVQSGSSYMRPKTYSTSESTVSGYTTSSTTHTHSVPAHAHTLTGGGYSVGAVNGLPTGQTTGDQGNMPPYLVINYIIATGRFE